MLPSLRVINIAPNKNILYMTVCARTGKQLANGSFCTVVETQRNNLVKG